MSRIVVNDYKIKQFQDVILKLSIFLANSKMTTKQEQVVNILILIKYDRSKICNLFILFIFFQREIWHYISHLIEQEYRQ